jgi:hypothetical protein
MLQLHCALNESEQKECFSIIDDKRLFPKEIHKTRVLEIYK